VQNDLIALAIVTAALKVFFHHHTLLDRQSIVARSFHRQLDFKVLHNFFLMCNHRKVDISVQNDLIVLMLVIATLESVFSSVALLDRQSIEARSYDRWLKNF
jgi:hypothetical protein